MDFHWKRAEFNLNQDFSFQFFFFFYSFWNLASELIGSNNEHSALACSFGIVSVDRHQVLMYRDIASHFQAARYKNNKTWAQILEALMLKAQLNPWIMETIVNIQWHREGSSRKTLQKVTHKNQRWL